MNKVLIVLLVLGAGALVLYLIGGDKGALPQGTEVASDVTAEEVAEALKETNPRTVYGSCNVIAEKSTCIDYVGSMWKDNNMAELNCKDVGNFSKNTCPYSDFGGCQTSAGTVMETIAWFYKEGNGGITEEAIPYSTMACNATPNSKWTTPDALLNN
jgi:hypothetical protein